ncbi:MAG: BamA/TamA family outer membrane protein [Verrucomicrobia bacterium]|nr:BamA/TamA family outer membrane protein [Verrucomicrobiota bacterium]
MFHPQHREPATPPSAITAGKTTVEFAGVTAFPEADLRTALADPLDTMTREGVSEATADDAAFFLELLYRKDGYAAANVAYDVLGPNRVRLRVNEGPRALLGDIRFVGNAHADSVNLREFVVGTTRERYPRGTPENALPYAEQDVQKGVELINRYYLALGYLDERIGSPPEVRYTNERTRADITVSIVEGRQYSFGEIALVNPAVFGDTAVRGQLADMVALPYTKPRVDEMARRIETFYKRRGYYAAAVTAESDANAADARGRIPVRLIINAGALYRFDGNTVQMKGRLKPQYLHNRFAVLAGQIYTAEALDEVYQEQLRTGLFNLLRVQPVPQPDNTLRLDIEAQEAKTREVGFSLGYGTFEGPIFGIELRDRDWLGTGRPVTLTIDYSTRTLAGELNYRDPYFLESKNQLNTRIYAQTRDLDAYTKNEGGFLAELSRPITKQFRVSAFALVKYDKLGSLSIDPGNAGTLSYTTTSLGVSAALDMRDNPVAPTRGLVSSVSFDVADHVLGGDLSFYRGTFRATYLWALPKNQTLAAGFRAGFVQPFGNTMTAFAGDAPFFQDNDPKTPVPPKVTVFPIDERFFNGGATSVRSFAERELGPYDKSSGQAIGGQAYTIFNLEYLFPIVASLQDLRGAVFFDAGNLRPRASQLGFTDERYGIGAGLRYNLPIGPLRLDYGVNPDPRQNEAFGAFHFSFGFAF